MTDRRPDPDALIVELRTKEATPGHGRLKVYLGMAAGVGKTYGMLADAQEARRRGLDVAIGYLEPHGRQATEALAAGLERILPVEVEHRGLMLKELDLDAALKRRPELMLVDELAHTNAPGMRHKRRWQDVEELLRSGIDVATTVNIQHLESLRDVVAQITGIFVQETVPDSLINSADQIELVDLPPEDLIRRIEEGKVYVPEKVQIALEGFFRAGNLSALRELALRRTAEHVDEQMRGFRQAATEPWHTTERIIVSVAPNRLAARVVRAAARMANSIHADLIAVFVESHRQATVTTRGRDLAADALRLAESLGAETVILSGEDIVQELIRLARKRNAPTIVVGKPIRPRWREIIFGSVVDELIRESGDINVFVITGAAETGTILRVAPPPKPGDIKTFGATIGIVGFCTILVAMLYPYFAPANLSMIYLLGVTMTAARYGQREAVLASLLSVFAFDVLFVPPRWTLAVTDVQYVMLFVVMLIVSLLISTLTARLRMQSQAASERERRTAALYDLSRRLAATRGRKDLGQATVEKVRELFDCDACVLLSDLESHELQPMPGSLTGFEQLANETLVARWVADHMTRAGHGTDTLAGAAATYFPLVADENSVGVLAVALNEALLQDQASIHLLETFASQLATAIHRANLAKHSHVAALQAETERLRSSLLSSVSHDLRTPLAVIEGSAESLMSSENTDDKQRGLAAAIRDEARRLGRLVRNLLDMTRMDSGAVELNRDWQSLEELVGAALSRTEPVLGDRNVIVHLAEELPLVYVDGVLLEQLLVNLLENASRYTPPGTRITISAESHESTIRVTVANNGPPLASGEEDAIFQRFHRKATDGDRGFGLGLAICRAIAEAHGGTIIGRNVETGVEFVITLPLPKAQPEVRDE